MYLTNQKNLRIQNLQIIVTCLAILLFFCARPQLHVFDLGSERWLARVKTLNLDLWHSIEIQLYKLWLLLQLEPLEKEWFITAARGNRAQIMCLLEQDRNLATKKVSCMLLLIII